MAAAGMLAGRLALVTGGGSGIGRAVCSVLAREGALLAVSDINKENAEETVSLLPKYNASTDALSGCAHAAFGTNVTSSSEVTDLINNVQKTFKAVPSVAVHSAGIAKDQFLLKLDEEMFDEVIAVNLKGTFLVNQTLGKAMCAAKVEEGSIVNIASIIGKVGNKGQAAYAASKSGVIGFTKTAAQELARNNIRVNSILPGFITTPMTSQVPEKVVQMVTFMIPLARMGGPEEVAEVCAFLASSRSSYVTGAAIEVTGGLFM
ncbi:estradiol 17-beta-dehydrogenase 8 [Aplysia californica]|uniref:Estradiol 17-beta-dehydrogenase 8 n=1 Tax=Aplysia californica TaxID=6500 RepID=A0ABM0JX17_APLCA|nr:estradiol 17-beta-dehydrogenase 8 [Aplysia californica]